MKCFVLLNHNLTEGQINELKEMGYNEIIYADNETKQIWGQVPLTDDGPVKVVDKCLPKINADACIVQGEMGSTFKLVTALQKRNIKCFHAVSKRESVEKVVDGKTIKQAVFKHIMFREY